MGNRNGRDDPDLSRMPIRKTHANFFRCARFTRIHAAIHTTERKHLTDIIKMVVYQAESDLRALLRPHFARVGKNL